MLVFEIGSSLREARTRQGFDFNEMEFRTKVRTKYLRALEAEQFDQLPGHTYIKGFLRTYADALGMDGQLYVDEYNSRFVAGDDERPLRTHRVPVRDRRPRQHRESRLVVLAVAAIVLVTALVIAAWKFGGPTEPRVAGVNAPSAAATNAATASVSIKATRGATFMEVRAGQAAGKPLYRGTLERGQTKRFGSNQRVLTLSVASPRNVVVRVQGVRVRVPASGQLTIPPRS